jgi:hypothetical protein
MAAQFEVEASCAESVQLADTAAFLELLARLRDGGAASEEERAAAALFRWDADIVVARAPGRMDVMGGAPRLLPPRMCLTPAAPLRLTQALRRCA